MDSILLESSPYHNPRLDLKDQNKQQKIYELVKGFVLPVSKLQKFIQVFTEEMKLGLVANPQRKSIFYMCNTFVTDFPDGTEEGDFLGMDLGGTNLRFYLVSLKRGTPPKFISRPYDIDVKFRTGTAEQLFDFLADCLDDFINRIPNIGDKRLPMGFTFSFGYEQKALNVGIMTQFSMATDLPDAIGKDAVQLFQNSINKKRLNIEVLAMLNDTTSTLAYGRYLKPDTLMGFLLGSGTNTCYVEKVDRIEHMDKTKVFGNKVENVVINCENGFIGDDGAIDCIKTKWDIEVDEESVFPHSYGFEKMVGGHFIGELVRKTILSLVQDNVLLDGVITDQLKQINTIEGPDVSSIESEIADESVTVLLQRLGYTSEQIKSDDISVVKYICALICVRNALLCAANISAVAQHIGQPFIRVATDGSVYKKHPKMHTLISDFVAKLIPDQKVELFLADEGSGKGSAFIAAVVDKIKRNV